MWKFGGGALSNNNGGYNKIEDEKKMFCIRFTSCTNNIYDTENPATFPKR